MYDILVEFVIQVSLKHSSFTSFVPCDLESSNKQDFFEFFMNRL